MRALLIGAFLLGTVTVFSPVGFVAASVLAAQEHGYTAADIESGARLYQSSCAGCHGASGDGILGVDFGRGQYSRASSDAEIAAIVRLGIPGTTMPPSGFSEVQAATLVAYLRNMAPSAAGPAAGTAAGAVAGTAAGAVAGTASVPEVVPGDPTRGRMLFEGKGQCASCHRVNGVGPRVAPDLSDVGAARRPAELQQKLLDPNALVRPGNRFFRAVTTDGVTVTGRLLNQDSFSIQLIDSSERLVSLSKPKLREYGFIRESPMPSSRGRLSAEEVEDLVSYLVSLKGLHQ